MHFALRAAADITGARRTCNAARRDESLYLSFFPAVITLGDDSVVIVIDILIVVSVARRISLSISRPQYLRVRHRI